MSDEATPSGHTLHALSDTDLVPDIDSLDVRGRSVIDRHGEKIGHVADLFIDEDERKVRMLEVNAGGFLGIGARHVLIPIDAITEITAAEVRVDQTREHIAKAPVYDPRLVVPLREDWEPLYGYYGLSPYWGQGYFYPQFPAKHIAPGERTTPS